MTDDRTIEVESTELLRTLIRNACVNDGTAASGQEVKNVDALEDFFARIVPTLTTGGTDAKFFRWKGITAYGFGLHSTRIPYTEYPLMFHGHNERVDTDSLRLSAQMWETVCREFVG
jgi:acetylornithine deacetylase/succinyl-diaminopimelate desuccinylase-like protein